MSVSQCRVTSHLSHFRMGPPHTPDRLHRNFLRIGLPTSGPRICGPHQARVSQYSGLMYTYDILLHAHLSCRFEPPRLRVLVLRARSGLPCPPLQCVIAQGLYHPRLEWHVSGVHKEGMCLISEKIARSCGCPRWKHQGCNEKKMS